MSLKQTIRNVAFIPLALLAGVGGNATAATPDAKTRQLLDETCLLCHNDSAKIAGVSFQKLDTGNVAPDTSTWEKILSKLSLGEMPPAGMPGPPQEELDKITQWLSKSLDVAAAAHPDPGRSTLRRLNRAEYANAVRDLLALDVNVGNQLPVDDSGYGFDNIADVLSFSPSLMERYIAVAGKVSRLATGEASKKESITDYRIPKDPSEIFWGTPSYNERSSDDLPLGSRGGGAFRYYAPYDADYTVRIFLNSNTSADTELVPANMYEVKVPLKAGNRVIGASFQRELSLPESITPPVPTALLARAGGRGPAPRGAAKMLPLDVWVDGARVNVLSVPSFASNPPAAQATYLRDVLQISVIGPSNVQGPGDTPSRRKIFSCRPSASLSEAACARTILATLARHAYRRPVTATDIDPLVAFYKAARRDSDFEHGIEAALEAILVSPKFLFMIETDPAGSKPGSVHRLSDVELASRLSFFLWSSIPDEELLAVAQQGKLKDPVILKQQVARMLSDSRSKALTTNFAGQWLYLRNVQYQKPDRVNFPDFDVRLRAAMLTETEMFFDSVVKENRSVLDFINANYTFLNQRLAEHYGIPGVAGTTFRRVTLDPSENRGGLLGQASILMVTSYDNRTSVVKRGKWILENLLAAPPPPPPPDVPALTDVKNGKQLTVREQMEVHRANPICASCHTKMDPLGFSLESYDAIGEWRQTDAGKPVDSSAVLPDGTKFSGPQGLRNILLARKDQFVGAVTGKLLVYALGRGLEPYDMPTVRAIRNDAARDNYAIGSVIQGIVRSLPFQMRRVPEK